jgi:predicted metal-dependent hydrolase
MAPLPSYSVTQSPKAKHLRLKVTPQDGLSVVVPRGFDEAKIPAILKQKKDWIADALAQAKESRRFFEQQPVKHLPERLELCAIGEGWSIAYHLDEKKAGIWLRATHPQLTVSGGCLGQEEIIAKLKEWLRKRVREFLFPLARNLAEKHNLPIRDLLVKNQRTRWASCSASKNLALNIKLLFLSPHLVRYVLIHELCHTVHMDHTKDFWRLVACHEPCYRVLDQSLRNAWKTVPQWTF